MAAFEEAVKKYSSVKPRRYLRKGQFRGRRTVEHPAILLQNVGADVRRLTLYQEQRSEPPYVGSYNRLRRTSSRAGRAQREQTDWALSLCMDMETIYE